MHKVVILSLHRTATQSTHKFLNDLGYSSLHYGSIELSEAEEDISIEKALIIFNESLERYDALSDIPFNVMYEYFDKRYDKCKFILITRPIEEWIKSVRKMYKVLNKDKFDVIDKIQYWKYLESKPDSIYECTDEDLKKVYNTHINQVREYFKEKNNFLEIEINSIGDGKRIAQFLNKIDNYYARWVKFKNIDNVTRR